MLSFAFQIVYTLCIVTSLDTTRAPWLDSVAAKFALPTDAARSTSSRSRSSAFGGRLIYKAWFPVGDSALILIGYNALLYASVSKVVHPVDSITVLRFWRGHPKDQMWWSSAERRPGRLAIPSTERTSVYSISRPK